MKLIVGLGNPGRRYEGTRHNLGFLVIDRLASQNGIVLEKTLCDALVGEGELGNQKVALAKPQTYMNRSGSAVAGLLHKYGVATADLAVINDDLDLPFGRIRVRPAGSAGGHRGLISITESLAGEPFLRVRMGIGRPPENVPAADYVLEPFNGPELEQMNDVVQRGAECVDCLLREGIERAMACYNRAS